MNTGTARFFCGIAVLVLSLTAAAHAAVTYDWKIPDNVRIVQKAPLDGVRTFATIQEAINSITNASATNPYLVKVLPGTYNEMVTMKPYVDLEGSGPDNTVIISSVLSDQTCSAATVNSANNAALRNLRVRNTANAPGSNNVAAIAILFDNVASMADNIGVDVGLNGAVTQENIGICVKGSSANVFLRHIDVYAKNESYDYMADALGIRLRYGGKIILKDSRVVTDGGINVLNSQWSSSVNVSDNGGIVEIDGCSLESVNGSEVETIYSGLSENIVVTSSKIYAYNGKGGTIAIVAGSSSTMVSNSRIYAIAGRAPSYYVCTGYGKIANSLIDGPVASSVKLINNYTPLFNPIPNQ